MTKEELQQVQSIANLLLANRSGKTPLTTEILREVIRKASLSVQSEEGNSFDENDMETVLKAIEELYDVWIDVDRVLQGDNNNWDPWLSERRGNTDWPYWQRYEKYLGQSNGFSPAVLTRLAGSTDKVLDFLGDPRRPGEWDRRGLVVGQVQSGKTSHYIGLINKAMDAGYKFIIVLTGFTENLRWQGQRRVDEGCTGFKKGRDLERTQIGVGNYNPNLWPNTVTTRTDDFRRHDAEKFEIKREKNPFLAVIKKNTSVLKHLTAWVEGYSQNHDRISGKKFVKKVPLLLIDDECDVGSVDTRRGVVKRGQVNPEHDPSRINGQIRKLLNLFEQSAYVGYTATPFANVLIHDQGSTTDLGDDLFPRSFIYTLAAPSNHIGPEKVFAEEADKSLPIVRSVPYPESGSDGNEWIPRKPKRKTLTPTFNGEQRVPPSLRKAILSFLLTCAARRLRKKGTKHNSMLVHVTRYINVNDHVQEQVEHELKGVIDRLRLRIADDSLIEELRTLWEEDFVPTTKLIQEFGAEEIFQHPVHAWEQIYDELVPAGAAIDVKRIYGGAGDVLDYEEYEKKNGLQVIAIGGDKLSRGLTLEGLSVSYFLRDSKMYDTLMQMGRWFGYRKGYLDLCRLYTQDELSDWFESITRASSELQNEFVEMDKHRRTPKEFGLKVRTHPSLLVTSNVKMRHASTVQISFNGSRIETINFNTKRAAVERNWKATQTLLRTGSKPDPQYSGVDGRIEVLGEDIVRFLENYEGHETATKANPRYLRKYVEGELVKGRLSKWAVHVGSGEALQEGDLGGVTRQLNLRGWYEGRGLKDEDKKNRRKEFQDAHHFRIRSLVSPDHEYVDLAPEDKRKAEQAGLEAYEGDSGKGGKKKDRFGPFYRQVRASSRGLLILYPIAPGEDGNEVHGDDASEKDSEHRALPIIGFAISFPGAIDATQVEYKVNNVYTQDELDFEEEEAE